MFDVQSWYDGTVLNKALYMPDVWEGYYLDANLAADGYCYDAACNNWMWGDVTQTEYDNWPHPIVAAEPSQYPGKLYWIVWEISVSFVQLHGR